MLLEKPQPVCSKLEQILCLMFVVRPQLVDPDAEHFLGLVLFDQPQRVGSDLGRIPDFLLTGH